MADSSNSAYLAAIDNVNSVLGRMTTLSDQWLAKTEDSIASLGHWIPPEEGTPPDLKPDQIYANALPEFGPPNPELFGEVGEFSKPDFDDGLTSLVPDATTFDPGTFNPKTQIPSSLPSGDIGDFNTPEKQDFTSLLGDLESIANAIPGPFSPKTSLIPVPTNAQVDLSGRPQAPTISEIDVPDIPDIGLSDAGQVPTATPVDVPTAPTFTLPSANFGDIPLFSGAAPNLTFSYSERPYTPQVMSEVVATIQAMLRGDFAMPQVLQDALFAAARDREDKTAQAAVEAAFDDWAGRGFSMPPGMLVEQVDTAREQSTLAQNTLSRDVYTKAAQWAIENLRTALAQGIALESAWMQFQNNIAQRAFDAAKTGVELAKDQFNLQVLAYNTNIAALNLKVAAFEAQVKVVLAQVDVYKGQIDAAKLKGDINEQNVRIYAARVTALGEIVKMYTARIEGAKVKADVQRTEIEGYRAEIEGWSQGIQTSIAVFNAQVQASTASATVYDAEARAFASTVQAASETSNAKARVAEVKLKAVDSSVQAFLGSLQAETAKINARRDAVQAMSQAFTATVQGYEAEARAYSATAQAQAERSSATARFAEAKLKAIDAAAQKFSAESQAEAARITATRDAIQARAQSFSADTGRWSEQIKYAAQGEEIRVRALESTVRNNMAYFQTISGQYEAKMQRMVQIGLAIKDALTSAGNMTAQMAAGALAAIHAQSSISGSGSTSDATSHEYKYNIDGGSTNVF